MVYSFVRRKHFSTAKSNIILIENLSIFISISKQRKGKIEKKDTFYIQRKVEVKTH
jgi:hypothetical protein